MFFGPEFFKKSCYIWNQHPWICLITKYCEIKKMPKFGTKSALFAYFWPRILKNYCHYWIQHPSICLTGKFCEETKMLKFGTKNTFWGVFLTKDALFEYFWAQIFKQNYWHIWNQQPWICLIAKYLEIIKCLNLRQKVPYLEIFGLEFLKTIVTFEISPSELV